MSELGILKKRAGHVIVTNNPAVVERYSESSRYIQGDVRKVFTTVRDAVHKGARVITHPLSGSVKPNESPYKSVIITAATGRLDLKSLRIIEDAIATLTRLPERNRLYDESVLEDFRIIDLNFMLVATST